MSFETPWKDLPVGNGPSAWIALHRRVTPIGDQFYSKDCQSLSDFQVAYWNTSSPYSVMDGDVTSYCVYNRIYITTANGGTTAKHGYTRAHCDEHHQFFCMSESGSCMFEEIAGYYGDSGNDYTDNDVIYLYESDDKCKQLCSDSVSDYPYTGLRVTEECWGFSTSASECRLHITVKPTYFDNLSHRFASASRKLFIKRCFASAVNYDKFNVAADTSTQPDSSCGTPTFVNVTSTSKQVIVYQDVWTWNEAFNTCKQMGLKLLDITDPADYTAVRQIVEKYKGTQSMDYVWIGLHEPNPLNHSDIRVWSDCGYIGDSNWHPDIPPSSKISDTSFCVLLDTRTNYWLTTKCNEQHHFICTGDYVANHSYSSGIQSTTRSEISIGPYNTTKESCREMCSTLTYNGQECWGFAVLEDEPDVLTECYILFMNTSNINISTLTEPTSEPFTLFTKQIWSDILATRSGESDSSLIPKSCCDVSGMLSDCPDNNVPDHSERIPTTESVEFILYTEARTWNEALMVCKDAGGILLQVDDAAKRRMVQRYVNTWIAEGDLTVDLWMGLSQLHSDDPCSLRWASDCSRPVWTDFEDLTYTADTSIYCTAINKDMKFVRRACDEILQFVCEIKTGSCDMLDVMFDINCFLGPFGSLLSVPLATCLSDCLSMVNKGTECWAAVKTGPHSCNLMFYVDPEYCKENNERRKGYEVFFKSCFSASVFRLPLVIPSDVSVFPRTSCLDLLPINLSDHLCYATTAIPDVTSTSAMPTSPMSQSSSSTESQRSVSTEDVSSTSSVSPLTTESSTGSHSSSTSEHLSPASSNSPFTSTYPSTTSLFISVTSTHSTSDPLLVETTTVPSITLPVSVGSTSPPSSTSASLSTTSQPSTLSTTSQPSTLSTTSQPSTLSTTSQPSTLSTTSQPSTLSTTSQPSTLSTTSQPSTLSTISQPSTLSTTSQPSTLSTTFQPSTLTHIPSTTKFTKPLYILPCLCYVYNKSEMTIDQWNEWFALSNTVVKQNTSRFRRNLTSAVDQRTSSLTVGMIVSSMFIALALYIITTDIPRFLDSVKYIRGIKSTRNEVIMKYKSL